MLPVLLSQSSFPFNCKLACVALGLLCGFRHMLHLQGTLTLQILNKVVQLELTGHHHCLCRKVADQLILKRHVSEVSLVLFVHVAAALVLLVVKTC